MAVQITLKGVVLRGGLGPQNSQCWSEPGEAPTVAAESYLEPVGTLVQVALSARANNRTLLDEVYVVDPDLEVIERWCATNVGRVYLDGHGGQVGHVQIGCKQICCPVKT